MRKLVTLSLAIAIAGPLAACAKPDTVNALDSNTVAPDEIAGSNLTISDENLFATNLSDDNATLDQPGPASNAN